MQEVKRELGAAAKQFCITDRANAFYPPVHILARERSCVRMDHQTHSAASVMALQHFAGTVPC
jgi:hypothetical protein